jgi:hypothetical protein
VSSFEQARSDGMAEQTQAHYTDGGQRFSRNVHSQLRFAGFTQMTSFVISGMTTWSEMLS